ncbi:MAG: PspA/IM30 family protein [Parcubacteria group bacterium]|nr:PspA/IM30 family protein [Parcubacteria group bacterium]
MSMSIFGKLRLSFLGTVHELLNKMIDLNSPAAIEQYLRDLEHAIEQVMDSNAQQVGVVNGFVRVVNGLNGRKETLRAAAKSVLSNDDSSDDWKAKTYAAQIVDINKELATNEAAKTAATQALDGLKQALDGLKKKRSQMEAALKEIQATDSATKAQDNATAAPQTG